MTTDPSPPTHTEVAIVGAGFAGLSAALTLGRAQRQVLVLGTGPTRNAESAHSHNLLTREGASPAELLATARAEVAALPTVTLADRHVHTITTPAGPQQGPQTGPLHLATADGSELGTRAARGPAGGQRAADDGGRRLGELTADAVLLATGVRDALPDVPGLVELWGRRAHSCPFCDAGLYAGGRLALLADPPAAAHLGGLLSGWTDRLRIIAPAEVQQVIEAGADVVIELVDGTTVLVDGVFTQATPLPRLDAVAGLALDRRGPYLAVDAEHRTSVDRLWAAGDCAWADGAGSPGGQVVQAMADGSVAAISIIGWRAGVTRPAPPERTPVPAAPAPPAETDHHAADHDQPRDARAFWEDRYASTDRVWSGRPSRALVEAVADATPAASPGTALELGCGEGADAIWLAEQGWHVTAVDLSATALDRAARAAERRVVGERITWVRADLAEGLPSGLPPGGVDLVLAAHLLSPATFPRDEVLRQAAGVVRPGGMLVILSHLHPPVGARHRGAHVDLPDVPTQLERLQLDGGWTVLRAEEIDVRHRTPDGTVATRRDSVLVLRRDR